MPRRTLEELLPDRWTGADDELAIVVQRAPRDAKLDQWRTDGEVRERVGAQVMAYLERFPPPGPAPTPVQVRYAVEWINHDLSSWADSPGSRSVIVPRLGLFRYL